MRRKLGVLRAGMLPERDLAEFAVGLHSPVDGALGVALGGVGTLVVELFALAQADFHLDAAMLEVERKGNESIALQLALLVQTPDLGLVGQQTPHPQRVLIEDVAVVVGSDVHSLDQKLAVLNIDPAVLQVDAAGTQALDLGAFQLDARFQRFEHEILVTRLAVCGDGLCRRTFLGRCHEARLLSFTPEAVFISIAHRPVYGQKFSSFGALCL